jgi:hypothetical protein
MNEHPEINQPRPKPKKSKGELSALADKRQAEAKEKIRRRRDGVREIIDRTRPRDDD